MDVESVFLRYIRMVLKKWTGLQAAIDDGMGGQYAKEKEIWLGSETEKYFKANDNLDPFEVEEFLAEILETEFNTRAEDGSIEEISEKFCNVFKLCKTGCIEEIEKLIAKGTVPPRNLPSTVPPKSVNEDVAAPLNSQFQQLSVENSNDDINSELLDDGWTQVKKGKHRRQKT